MPNITLFIPAAAMPPDEAVAELSDRCALLCTGLLRAALANVHVACVAVQHGRGHPVFADVRYRLEPFRTPAVMEAFMQCLEEAILQTLRLMPRIRCFGYAAPDLHARN